MGVYPSQYLIEVDMGSANVLIAVPNLKNIKNSSLLKRREKDKKIDKTHKGNFKDIILKGVFCGLKEV